VKDNNTSDAELRAWGELMAEMPQVEELIAYHESLPRQTKREKRRELVLAKARELGLALGGTKLLDGPEIPQWVLHASLWDGLRWVVDALAPRFGAMTVQQLLLKLSDSSGIDNAVYNWVAQTVESGIPAPYPAAIRGGSIRIELPALDGCDEREPMLLCAVTPMTDMDEFMADLRDKAHVAFKGYKRPQPGTVAEAARIFAWLKEGKTKEEIAWLLLGERFPEVAAADEETRQRDYKDEYKKERARLRQMVRRL